MSAQDLIQYHRLVFIHVHYEKRFCLAYTFHRSVKTTVLVFAFQAESLYSQPAYSKWDGGVVDLKEGHFFSVRVWPIKKKKNWRIFLHSTE